MTPVFKSFDYKIDVNLLSVVTYETSDSAFTVYSYRLGDTVVWNRFPTTHLTVRDILRDEIYSSRGYEGA